MRKGIVLPAVPDFVVQSTAPAQPGAACGRTSAAFSDTIQPHGALIAFDAESGTVAACSANTALFLDRGPGELLGNGVDALGIAALPTVIAGLRSLPPEARALGCRATVTAVDGAPLAARLHERGGRIILEVERLPESADAGLTAAIHDGLQPGLANLREATSLDELAARAAWTVRRLTGMERVILCRFDADGTDTVIGEAGVEDWGAPMLGTRFPGSGEQTSLRALHAAGRFRMVPDRDAEPVPLLHAVVGVPPLDLRHADLPGLPAALLDGRWAVGGSAVLSVAILKSGKPWGVILGQHRHPHAVPPALRALALAVADAFSLGLEAAGCAAEREARAAPASLHARLLEQVAGSRAKSEFLTKVSHELRTPLNAIIGFSEFLLDAEAGPLTDRQRDFVRNIKASGTHLLELINDVLDLSKIEAGRFELHDEEIDVATAIGEIHALQEHALVSTGLRFDATLPRPLPQLRADRRALRQMLLNLMSNAVKYTPKGGRVMIDVARTSEGLAIAVVDTGIGIAEEFHSLVLEPFRQVPSDQIRNRAGTGLGLPIVRSLVEAHGGRLALASTPGQGTRITLHFPMERVIV